MNAVKIWLLPAILFLGFSLRLLAVDFGLPFLYHADEPIIVNHALAYGSGDLNPHFFKIPPLISYLLFFCYGVVFIAGKILSYFPDTAAFEKLFYTDPTLFYLTARVIFGVVAGTLSILIFYKLLRVRFENSFALAGAFLFSICFLHVRDSHYVYADIPLVLVILVSMGIFSKLVQNPSLKLHFLCGAMIGLAAAVKYNGAVLVFPYLTACFFSSQNRFPVKGWLTAGFASTLIFICLNPFSVIDFSTFQSELMTQSQAQGGTSWYHHYLYSLAGGMGWPLLLVSTLGFFAAITQGKAEDRVWVVFAGIYYLVLVRAGQHYDRYVLPLLPFMIYFALSLFATNQNHAFLKGRKLFAFILILAAIPLTKSVLFIKIMSASDTRTLAREWVHRNIPAGSPIAIEWEFYMPRLNFSETQLLEKKATLEQGQKKFSGAKVRRLDALIEKSKREPGYQLSFLVTDPSQDRFLMARPAVAYDFDALWNLHRDFYVIRMGFPERPETKTFFAHLRKQGRLIARFSPYKNPKRWLPYDAQPMTGGPFLWTELWNRQRGGVSLEIYHVSQPPNSLTA